MRSNDKTPAAPATALPVAKTTNPHPGGTAAYLATEHYNEGWNDCLYAIRKARIAAPAQAERPVEPEDIRAVAKALQGEYRLMGDLAERLAVAAIDTLIARGNHSPAQAEQPDPIIAAKDVLLAAIEAGGPKAHFAAGEAFGLADLARKLGMHPHGSMLDALKAEQPREPGHSCDPADICAGCRCKYSSSKWQAEQQGDGGAIAACPQCGGSLSTWKCTCDPIWSGYAAEQQGNPPFQNCSFQICDLPGQCRSEGKCHHPRGKYEQQGDDCCRGCAPASECKVECGGLKEQQGDGGALTDAEAELLTHIKHFHTHDFGRGPELHSDAISDAYRKGRVASEQPSARVELSDEQIELLAAALTAVNAAQTGESK